MKLNNKGWGLNTMLLCVATILIFLIIAAFFTIRLNKMIEDLNKNDTKSNVDIKDYIDDKLVDMISASDKYLKDTNILLERGSYLKIDLDTLIDLNYINAIKDPVTNNKCKGYTKATINADNIKDIKAYIKCDNYKSGGYDE